MLEPDLRGTSLAAACATTVPWVGSTGRDRRLRLEDRDVGRRGGQKLVAVVVTRGLVVAAEGLFLAIGPVRELIDSPLVGLPGLGVVLQHLGKLAREEFSPRRVCLLVKLLDVRLVRVIGAQLRVVRYGLSVAKAEDVEQRDGSSVEILHENN